MRTTLFTLPFPLLALLAKTLALPAPAPANNPSPLEAYLDFNLERSQSSSSFPTAGHAITHAIVPSNAIPVSFNAHAKRGLDLDLKPQIPIPIVVALPNSRLSGERGGAGEKAGCKAPRLEQDEVDRLMASLTGEMLAIHRNGIAFPYSTNTHCSASVELTARSAIPLYASPDTTPDSTSPPLSPSLESDSESPNPNSSELKRSTNESSDIERRSRLAQVQVEFNAKLKLTLKPKGRDVYGMKRMHFVSLLERIGNAGLDFDLVGEGEGEGGGDHVERRRGALEGVSGDVEFVARFVVTPILGGGCGV